MANIDDQLLDILRWPNNKKPVRQSTATQIKLEQIDEIKQLLHSLLISKLPTKKYVDMTPSLKTGSQTVTIPTYNEAIDDMHQVIDELFGVK